MIRLNALRALAAFALAIVSLSACGESLGLTKREPVSLSIATMPPSTSAGGVVASPAALDIVAGNGHVLDLQNADLTLEDVRLERHDDDNDQDTDSDEGDSDGDSDSDSDSDNNDDTDDSPTLNTGPLTIALPLGGGVITPITRAIPVGTYDELEAELAFLRLRGTYDGAAFDVTFAIDREIQRELVPPLVVRAGDDDANVTLSVSFIHCFRDAAGTPIDPRRIQTDEALRASLRACITRAFHAFEDHDRDADDEDSDSDTDD